jgi:hypothetical protein
MVFVHYVSTWPPLSPHPEEPRSGVSKDGPVGSGEIWSILRDALRWSAPQDEGLREVI